MSNSQGGAVRIEVVEADALWFTADVLAVKYAQQQFGVDHAVVDALAPQYGNLIEMLPKPDQAVVFQTRGTMSAAAVLFVGVKPLSEFGYAEIREFAQRAVASLPRGVARTGHLALTLHGAGYGLDEREAFVSEVAGLTDSILSGNLPESLARISIVERNSGRATRLKQVLADLIPAGEIRPETKVVGTLEESLRSAGYSSNSKPNVFVAMPFVDNMDDVFHYGIQNAVNGAGYLCERADQSSFTGDILDWIKGRIAAASLVIADLSLANPNVYLEVGYAWGCRKPTILAVRDPNELKFDVKGQRCLVYKNIKDLETKLQKELASLQSQKAGAASGE